MNLHSSTRGRTLSILLIASASATFWGLAGWCQWTIKDKEYHPENKFCMGTPCSYISISPALRVCAEDFNLPEGSGGIGCLFVARQFVCQDYDGGTCVNGECQAADEEGEPYENTYNSATIVLQCPKAS